MLKSIAYALVAAAIAQGAIARAHAQAASTLPLPLRLTAFAVNMSNVGTGGA